MMTRWLGRRHLFYDTPSNPARAEALLLVGDLLMLGAPVFLATAMFHRPDSASDSIFLALWLMIPRALARCLSWMERPRDPVKVYAISAAFVITVSVLLFAGWELIYTENRKYVPIGHGTAGVIMLSWIVTLFLFQPRTYRLYDFLCGGVLLLALLETKPEAWLWVPLFFAGLLLSGTTRHLLHDVAHGSRRRQVPLQNARVLAVGGALAASLVFFALYFVLHRGLDFPRASDLAGAETAYRYSSPLIAKTPDGPRRGSISSEARPSAELVQREGRGYRLRILSYASRPDSHDVAWRVRPVEDRTVAGWPPRSGVLWRALSLSTFDPEDDAWVEASPLHEAPWPSSATLEFDIAPPYRGAGPTLDLEYEVELPVFRNLLAMHRHSRWTAGWIRSAERSEAGDVFPDPALKAGSVYRARTRMEFPNPRPFPEETGGSDLSPGAARRYLALPDATTLGVDLGRLAAEVFAGATTVGDRVRALERFFRTRNFLYRRDEVWSGAGAPYERFFTETRIGNCTHYATSSALLLRAAGVRTRFVAGFLDGRQDTAGRSVLLEVSMAHAWIEVHVPGRGWYAVDATAWVPLAPNAPARPQSGVPHPAAADSGLAGGTRGAGGTTTDLPSPDFEQEDRFRVDLAQGSGPELASGGSARRAGRGGAGGSRSAGEDYSTWFEFTRLPRGEGGGLESRDGSRGGRGGEFPANDGSMRERQGRVGESDIAAARSHAVQNLGLALRILILATGALVAILVLVTYRFARKRQGAAESDGYEEGEDGFEDPFDQALATEIELYGESTPRGAIVAEYQRLQRDLARTRNHRRRHQTPREHGSWLAGRFEEIRGSLAAVVDLLYRAVYASEDVTRDDAESHGESCRRVRKYMR